MIVVVRNVEDERRKQRREIQRGVDPDQRPALPEVSLRFNHIKQKQQDDRPKGITENRQHGAQPIMGCCRCGPILKAILSNQAKNKDQNQRERLLLAFAEKSVRRDGKGESAHLQHQRQHRHDRIGGLLIQLEREHAASPLFPIQYTKNGQKMQSKIIIATGQKL